VARTRIPDQPSGFGCWWLTTWKEGGWLMSTQLDGEPGRGAADEVGQCAAGRRRGWLPAAPTEAGFRRPRHRGGWRRHVPLHCLRHLRSS